MKLSRKIASIQAILEAKLFNKRTPLLVNWEITKRCNARCKYCSIWNSPSKELDTKEVSSIIQELGLLGTQMIHFTGGEPLLREDVGIILDYCHKNNILTSMNSNGAYVPQRINEITTLYLLGISIDGPEDVHDYIRGKGSYRRAIEAITAARNKGIKLRLLTVLSECNLDVVDFLLEKSTEFNAPIIFQPATQLLLGAKTKNPIAPNLERYKQTIKKLIAKKSATKYIVNSVSGLNFLYNWPDMKRVRCLSQLVSCRIQSDGHVYRCYRNQDQAVKIDEKRNSIKDSFSQLPFVHCNCCCCASSVELNCLLSLKLDTIFNSWGFI
jgi:MoaA/NifB/PqqE/SkfB family radical SAM enzyme